MFRHLMSPCDLNIYNSKIWALKWNKNHFSLFQKWSPLHIKNESSENVADTTFKAMTPHIFLNFYKFFGVVFHFFVNSVLSFSVLWLFLIFFDYFFQLIYFHDGFHKGFERKNFWSFWCIYLCMYVKCM